MRDTNLALELLLKQFLAQLAEGPRGYAETMDAWRTHCPRLAVWEEACERGLVTLSPGQGGMRGIQVSLSDAGRALLAKG